MANTPKLVPAKKGQKVELLEDLPSSTVVPLVAAGVFGTISKVAGGLFRKGNKFNIVFDLGGPNNPLVLLRNVRRDQFKVAGK